MEDCGFLYADSYHPLLRASLIEEEILEPQGDSLLRALLKRKEILEQQGDSLLQASLKGKEILKKQDTWGEITEADDDSDVESHMDACCRICLERHNNREGSALISPCMCKGTQQFVHRSCLDQWRSIKEGFAFSHCTICKAQYHIRVELTETYCWRKLKFQFFVARDIFLIFLVLQIIIITIGSLAYLVDKDGNFRNFFNNEWIHGLSEYPLPFYYCLGVLVFLVIFGVFGVIMHCATLQNGLKLSTTDDNIDHYPSDQYSDVPVLVNAPVMDPTFSRDECVSHKESTYIDGSPICCSSFCCCCFCARNDNPRVTKKRSSCNNGNYGSNESGCNCTRCDCICIGSDCNCHGSSNDTSSECLVMFLIVFIIIFAILGILYGIFAATIVFQRIWQRYYHILIKRELTKEYVVEDLHGNYSAPTLDTHHENRLKFLKLL